MIGAAAGITRTHVAGNFSRNGPGCLIDPHAGRHVAVDGDAVDADAGG